MMTPHVATSAKLVTTDGFSSTPKHAWRQLVPLVAAAHRMSSDEMLSPDRRRPYVRARWHLMAILHDRGWSYPKIGALLGMDHSSCIYGVRQHRKLAAL